MYSNQPSLRYGLVCGNERGFEYFSMKDMNSLILAAKWRVPQKDWASNGNVHLVEQCSESLAPAKVSLNWNAQ